MMEDELKHSMEIAARLDEAMRERSKREGRKFSQSRLMKLSGVPQSTISRILKGTQPQGAETSTIRKLADAMELNFHWLNDGEMPKSRIGLVTPIRPDVELPINAAPMDLKDMPATPSIPMAMTGPHWLTPDEWLLVSLFRRTDDIGRIGVLDNAGHQRMVINPPAASNDSE